MKGIIFLIILLLAFCVVGYSDTSSTTMEIRIIIPPITMFEVSSDWQIVSNESELVQAQATYGVTCNVKEMKINARLAQPLPQNVQISLNAVSTIGQSTGWTTLEQVDTEYLLVYNPRGNEHSIIEMRITKPQDLEFGSFPVEIEIVLAN